MVPSALEAMRKNASPARREIALCSPDFAPRSPVCDDPTRVDLGGPRSEGVAATLWSAMVLAGDSSSPEADLSKAPGTRLPPLVGIFERQGEGSRRRGVENGIFTKKRQKGGTVLRRITWQSIVGLMVAMEKKGGTVFHFVPPFVPCHSAFCSVYVPYFWARECPGI